jgi:site-specific recombinase XerD
MTIAGFRLLRDYVHKINGEYLFPVNKFDAIEQYRKCRFFEEHLSELCEKAGIERITPHQLRHFFATHTLYNGADVKAVSEMLGQADVGITLKIYHHVNAKSIMQMHRMYSPLKLHMPDSRLLYPYKLPTKQLIPPGVSV